MGDSPVDARVVGTGEAVRILRWRGQAEACRDRSLFARVHVAPKSRSLLAGGIWLGSTRLIERGFYLPADAIDIGP